MGGAGNHRSLPRLAIGLLETAQTPGMFACGGIGLRVGTRVHDVVGVRLMRARWVCVGTQAVVWA